MKFKKSTLPNGLRVITVPLKDSLSTTAMVLVETGSNYEKQAENGLSHFLEHMVFKGTKNRPTSQEIARELDSIGAYNNAFTSNEVTGYFAKAENKHFPKILNLLADMYLHPLLPEKDLEIERGVILEEIEMYEDRPQAQVGELAMKLLYGETPAGRPIIGPRENIKKFQRKDFVKYRELHYTAEKTFVVVSGNVSHQQVLREVKKNFRTIPVGKRAGKPVVKEKQKAPALLVKKKKSNQAHLIFAFHAFPANDKRLRALSVLDTVLGGGMSSRLFHKMREEMGACYYVKAEHEALTDHGIFSISTGINVSRTVEVTRAILAECRRLRDELVSETELEKAKEYLVGQLFRSVETGDGLAGFYGLEEVVTGKLQTPLELEKELRQVTAKQIQQVAREIFREEKLNLAIVGQISSEKALRKALTLK